MEKRPSQSITLIRPEQLAEDSRLLISHRLHDFREATFILLNAVLTCILVRQRSESEKFLNIRSYHGRNVPSGFIRCG